MNDRDGRQNILAFVGLVFFGFMILNVLKDQGWVEFGGITAENSAAASESGAALAESPNLEGTGGLQPQAAELSLPAPLDANAIVAPYERFAITQGIHGADYDHMAIDISAGKGATIQSPINGEITALFIDEWGNPSLIIENARYKIEMLHGLYTVKIGDRVAIGQPIGTESNQGNVADPWGFSCRNRDCGYHTHINVYDKDLGSNVNPLILFHSN